VTVAIGLVCSDGVIVASDSMASVGNTARPMCKVYAEDDLHLVWTAAGSVYVIEEVAQEIAAAARGSGAPSMKPSFTAPDLNGIRDRLGKRVHDRIKTCYEAALPFGLQQTVQPQVPTHVFSTDFLFLGWARQTPWFLEVSGDGQMNWHTSQLFAALGSGGEFASVAQALMKHHVEGGSITVEDGLLVAYRAIETTCEVSARSVGLPVWLAVVTDQKAEVLDRAEIDKVGIAVERWKTIEVDTLAKLRAPEGEEPQSDLPKIESDANGITDADEDKPEPESS
jgi:20S proteasome alpha/beta subunit